ncbi:hypothetical protein FPZ42_03295 [Mucilaginibacter achroorhodeus]|uniref:Organic solvent tolerance-like N-terminal domain-containing protein n=1 Tax=Mucilaginibacter achroorhodeus TaxID=2599294 RepID=A0A563UAE6_9SPHI|nr:OstA-like protein [Mucilaginibacter achroorhodeus]TWR28253.1 hypothetical protein FPZ42_03295 [Mucilaginibacter achroorhodeus]
MIKYILSALLLLLTSTVSAQKKKSVVKLISSKNSQLVKINGKDVVKVFQGVFTQDFSTMRSDSGYFYAQDNAFDAFGNVHITQGDTLNIYSDKLNYNGNTKIAILTDNVRMVDKDAILTTNYLTYNTATRIGTYTGGGKLINKDNTLTSKNGYYFAYSRDSYFRYNVVLVTPDALIKTDTLRYNTGSRIAFFYGPTNIYDTKQKKDTLYTENGTYNTATEQAFFGKKNLYKQDTKTFTGDSLFYDRAQGYGRAIKNIVFKDKKQNMTLKGQLADYYRATERVVVTQDPYVIIVTEQKDTTQTDTTPVKTVPAKGSKVSSKGQTNIIKNAAANVPKNGLPLKSLPIPIQDSVKADTARIKNTVKRVVTQAGTLVKKADLLAAKTPAGTMPVKSLSGQKATDTTKNKTIVAPPQKIKRDSVFISADTLESQMLTFKDYKAMQAKPVRDTTAKAKKKSSVNSKTLMYLPPWQRRDTSLIIHRDYFAAMLKARADSAAAKAAKNKSVAASKNGITGANGKVAAKQPKAGGDGSAPRDDDEDLDQDPLFYTPPLELKDTARIRIVKAYHNAKMFKSDLQAKSDSMFYSYADSTLRMYVNPILWAQNSQLSGDTIMVQMKNKKMDNLTMYPSSFIVNIEEGDSTHFNQVAGKRMKGYFLNDKLDRMFVVGNAESIYFSRDSLKKVDGMQRSVSSRMRVHFKNNKASTIVFLTKPEHRYGPLSKFTEEDKVLKGFIWKPKERPASKEAILPSYRRKMEARNPTSKKPSVAKPGTKPTGTRTLDSLRNKPTLSAPATNTSGKSKTTVGKSNKQTVPTNNTTDSVKVKVPVRINTDTTNVVPAPIQNRQREDNTSPLAPKNIKKDTVVTKQL